MRDQVSHTYKTTGIIIVVYNPMFVFLDSKRGDKDSAQTASTFPEFNLLLIS
jgi:hypothetical protein